MNLNIDKKPKHTIKAVALKTGLSTFVIRAWERRYQAVSPQRTGTNRRLYTDEDIRRLMMLYRATQAGESIGQIANLSTDELIHLAGSAPADGGNLSDEKSAEGDAQSPSHYVEKALEAARKVDSQALEGLLMKAAVSFSQPVLLQQVLEPLMYKTGELWRDGSFKIVHEHIVSAVVRTLLGGMLNTQYVAGNAPTIILTTPAGQLHEFGALLAAVTAAADGWKTVYLGPNMPVDDIANAVVQRQAGVVALSLVYPSDNHAISQEFFKLRKFIGNDVAVLVGGNAAAEYKDVFDRIGATCVETLDDFRRQLDKLRHGKSKPHGSKLS